MKLEFQIIDVCLPDYFAGSNKAHIAIPVYHGMKLADIKGSIRHEISHGNVDGSGNLAFLLSADYVGAVNEKGADKATKAAYAAVNRIKGVKKGQRTFFKHLDKDVDGNSDSVYAYFAIEEI